jgi:hypothetical protein
MIEFDVGCANQATNATSKLNIFEQTLITNDLAKNLALENYQFLEIIN